MSSNTVTLFTCFWVALPFIETIVFFCRAWFYFVSNAKRCDIVPATRFQFSARMKKKKQKQNQRKENGNGVTCFICLTWLACENFSNIFHFFLYTFFFLLFLRINYCTPSRHNGHKKWKFLVKVLQTPNGVCLSTSCWTIFFYLVKIIIQILGNILYRSTTGNVLYYFRKLFLII